MKKISRAFTPFLKEITHDYMLVACNIGPIIIGCAFRFLLPTLENLLCRHFGMTQILTPYYIIFDLILVIMTPILFCFAGVLVFLDEFDSGVAKYYTVTPLGKGGYLFSRIGVPAIISFVYDIVLLSIFTASGIHILMNFVLCISGGLTAIITSLIVVTFAKNKMEGMALVKLCGLLIIGIPVAYFITSPVQYLFCILPSYWMAKLCITKNYIFLIPTLLSSFFIILGLCYRFRKKLL